MVGDEEDTEVHPYEGEQNVQKKILSHATTFHANCSRGDAWIAPDAHEPSS